MFRLLYEYLLKFHSLSLPGIGEVRVETTKARADVTAQEILPPAYQYVFDAGKTARLSRLYEWLADREGVEESEAVQQLNDFSRKIKETLNAGKTVEWSGVGRFNRQADGHVAFESEEVSSLFLQPVSARKVIHEGASHAMLVGEKETTASFSENRNTTESAGILDAVRPGRWWIWPLVIGLLGLVFIGWYCSQHGFNVQGAASHY